MSGGIQHLVQAGPLILAAPIAAAAGALTFLSPCVLPLVPGYLSYVTGMSGTDAQRAEAAAAERVAVAPDGTAVPSDGAGDGAGQRRVRPAGVPGGQRAPAAVGRAARPAGAVTAGRPPEDGPCSARRCSSSGSLSCSPPRAWPSAAWGWCWSAIRTA